MTPRWQFSAIVIAATVLGAIMRLYLLDSLPPQAWVDEAWFNLRARDLVQTGDFHVFYRTFWGGMHPAMVDLAAIVHASGFQSLVASRIVAALAGIVTIPLAAAAVHEVLYGTDWPPVRRRLVAALTAVVTSTLLYLVIASRIGYDPALIPPLMLIYVWQSRRGQRSGNWINWAAAGLALGVAQYAHQNGRFLVVLAVALGLHDLSLGSADRRRSTFLGLCLAAAVAVAVALPLIAFFVREPQWLFARAAHITGGLDQHWLEFLLTNAVRTLASINIAGDLNPRHNLPGRPMFDWLQSAGFLVGVTWALRNLRRAAASRVLLTWLFVMMLSSIITDEAPHFLRMIGVGVPTAALVAVGWVELWTWLKGIGSRAASPWNLRPALIGVALVALSSALSAYNLFVVYPRTQGLSTAMTTFPVELARDLIGRAETEAVFVERLREVEDVYAFDFMLPGTAVRRLDFRACLPLSDQRSTRTTYLVYPDRDRGAAARLRHAYPTAAVRRLQPEAATLMERALLFEVPAGARPSLQHPGRARFGTSLTLIGYDGDRTTVAAGESISFTTYWRVESKNAADGFTVFAQLEAVDAKRMPLALTETTVCRGLRPIHWRQGDVIPTDIVFAVPRDARPGEYAVAIGWQERPSLQRLTLVDADRPLPGDRAQLATVTIVTAERE